MNDLGRNRPDESPQGHRVLFRQSGRVGRFPAGSTLLQAAQALGEDLSSVCGGRALCGRCQVVVSDGTAQMGSIAGHVSPMQAAEREYLAETAAPQGYRLACRARLCGDVEVEVPHGSRIHRQVVRKPNEAHAITVRPVVTLHLVAVDPPRGGDADGDLERFSAALSRQWSIERLDWDPAAAADLQQALRDGNWQVTAAIRNDRRLVALWPGLRSRVHGVSVDIGSTTLAVQLCDLASGEVLAEAGCANPQIGFGEDLMSRISYGMNRPDGRAQLTSVVRRAINELIAGVARQAGIAVHDIVEATVVGNSVMHHLFLGWDPCELGRAPFTLVSNRAIDVQARDVGIAIHPGAYLYALPCIAGHIGADMAGVLLAEAPWDGDEITLVVDVGTNAEMALGNRTRVLAASSPTGPAFEGAHVSAGQRAAPGAVERVRIDAATLEPRYRVIGCHLWSDEPGFAEHLPPGGITGVCGSGIIEVIAELYRVGVVAADGRILGERASDSARIVAQGRTFAYSIVDGESGVRVTQSDVRAIQLAKAALYAGARLLMDRLGVDHIDRVRLAGAFGAQIDVRYAMTLGMIPDCPLEHVTSAGNAAGTGARIALLDRQARRLIQRRVEEIERVETATEPQFHEYFVAALAIPHASDPFDRLRSVVALPARNERRNVLSR